MPYIPKEIEAGQPIVSGVNTKIREILAYLHRSQLIPGKGVSLTETPGGIFISIEASSVTPGSYSGKKPQKAAVFEYTGPWGLSFYGNEGSLIRANPGLIWTPDGTKYGSDGGNPPVCPKPNVSSLIILSYESYHAVISTLSDPLGPHTESYPHYWDTHAILGKYDAESDSLIQYHFSPIVFFIETEDLVITP